MFSFLFNDCPYHINSTSGYNLYLNCIIKLNFFLFQAVVLEGKYWKRQTTVIKAEYRKWRKNSKSKTAGCLTYDTVSSDFLMIRKDTIKNKSFDYRVIY